MTASTHGSSFVLELPPKVGVTGNTTAVDSLIIAEPCPFSCLSETKAGAPSAILQEPYPPLTPGMLRELVERISIPRHHIVNAEANVAVADWPAEEFSHWEYLVSFQGRFRNVITQPATITDKVILVGAHYDSVPTTPGADDNGSAVAAMRG